MNEYAPHRGEAQRVPDRGFTFCGNARNSKFAKDFSTLCCRRSPSQQQVVAVSDADNRNQDQLPQADDHSCQTFWQAVVAGDLLAVREILSQQPWLASADCRAAAQRDPHTNGFPLVQAAKGGNVELARVLLQHNADVNARSPAADQREFGMPIILAFDRQNYELITLLLDRGASVHAFPYCDICLADRVYIAAREHRGESKLISQLVRLSMNCYLAPNQSTQAGIEALGVLSRNAPESINLFARILFQGGQPTLGELVRQGERQLLEELLQTCPEKPGTQFDYPGGNIFQNICGAASWHGYPEILTLCMSICPQLYGYRAAKDAIHSATISHNRDGSYQDYRTLIEGQLRYLQERGELAQLRDGDDPFKAHSTLAANFCWPRNYGFRAEISTAKNLIDLAELFIEYGFNDFNFRDPKTGRTPLAICASRGTHPGMLEYAKFLIDHGADGCSQDPPESNPLALAKQMDDAEYQTRREAFLKSLSTK